VREVVEEMGAPHARRMRQDTISSAETIASAPQPMRRWAPVRDSESFREVWVPPTRAGAATGPTVFPFEPLFRGARSFVVRRSASAGQSALPVRRMTVIAGLNGEMPPRQILLDGVILHSNSWRFDPAAHVVSWQSGEGGSRHEGRLKFTPAGTDPVQAGLGPAAL
jgi:hypothetical protein